MGVIHRVLTVRHAVASPQMLFRAVPRLSVVTLPKGESGNSPTHP